MNKKAMFFSLMTGILVIVILFGFQIKNSGVRLTSTNSKISRIESVDRFVYDVTEDLNRAIYISAYRTIIGANQYIAKHGEFVNSSVFFEGMINGTINGEINNITARDNLNDWKNSIDKLGTELGIKINTKFTNIDAKHITPWIISFEVNVTFEFFDYIQNSSNFIFNDSFESRISIIGLEDPIYNIYSNGAHINLINKSSVPREKLMAGSNTTELKKFVSSQNYVQNSVAPSYLNRLFGNLSSDEFGIESMVNVAELDSSYVYNRSVIDHLYWIKDIQSFKVKNISEDWDWFRLDQEHLNSYNATKLEN